MIKIEWNRVTWYSKLLAIVVFLVAFVIAFNLGALWERTNTGTALTEIPTTVGGQTGGKAGAHCGGFIQNAPTCASGYHCQLTVSRPDTGGICVKD
jgi:hypothetical protein